MFMCVCVFIILLLLVELFHFSHLKKNVSHTHTHNQMVPAIQWQSVWSKFSLCTTGFTYSVFVGSLLLLSLLLYWNQNTHTHTRCVCIWHFFLIFRKKNSFMKHLTTKTKEKNEKIINDPMKTTLPPPTTTIQWYGNLKKTFFHSFSFELSSIFFVLFFQNSIKKIYNYCLCVCVYHIYVKHISTIIRITTSLLKLINNLIMSSS